jgi:hypothetical protein
LCAADVVRDNFAVINADDFYGQESYAVLNAELSGVDPSANTFSMVGFTLRNTLSDHGSVARGVCTTDENALLTHIDEMTNLSRQGSGAIYTRDDGSTVNLTSGSELKSECFIPLTVGQLISEKHVTCKVLRSNSTWFGVTYKEDKEIVQGSIAALVETGKYPKNLWA